MKKTFLLVFVLILVSSTIFPHVTFAQTGSNPVTEKESVETFDDTANNSMEQKDDNAEIEQENKEKEEQDDLDNAEQDEQENQDKEHEEEDSPKEEPQQEEEPNQEEESNEQEENQQNDSAEEDQLKNENGADQEEESSQEESNLSEEEPKVEEETDSTEAEENEEEAVEEEEETKEEVSTFMIQATPKESKTSKLGHLFKSATIYKKLGDNNSKLNTSKYLDAVYYIKKQASYNGDTYYLISTQASATKGTIGWVKSSQISVHTHKGMDKQSKKLFVKGNGKAFSKAWGGSKDQVYNLSSYKGQVLEVNKTERVGNNTWYRGYLNGKQVFVHEAYVTKALESSTSILGHLYGNATIYKELGKTSTKLKTADYTDAVYYIKKQAVINGETHYLISTQPSTSKGTIGWVKSSHLKTHTHKGVDRQSKKMFVKGSGQAFSKAWGGSKDQVYNLSSYKGYVLDVNKTEKVGNNIWYRGYLNGKEVFIHEAYVSSVTENSTSRLGHLRGNADIYKELGNSNTQLKTADYINAVYYIKKQAVVNGETHYLISTQPSATEGTIGWVKSSHVTTHTHKGVDRQSKTLFVEGDGQAFSKAWGGSKDLVYNLSNYEDQEFIVNKTESVGSNTWYRGHLAGKQVFIHEAYVTDNNITYQNFNVSLNSALNTQMNQLQQTDKYRNSPAYVHKDYVSISADSGVINGSGVRLRSAANFNNNIKYTVNQGTAVEILGTVNGSSYQGSTKWYKIKYNNQTLYVHTSLVDDNGSVAKTTANVNVRSAANTSSHIYGTISTGKNVTILNTVGSWYQISYQTWRNPTRNDVLNYLNPDNHDIFQHLSLSNSVGVSASSLNNILAGKGTLSGEGQAFINGAKQHNVNEVYLISHALLETGHGTSSLAKGIQVGRNKAGNPVLVTSSNRSSLSSIKTVYNMFGIGAIDGDAHRAGAVTAYQEGWTSPDKAIVGGAKFIGDEYVHNRYKQDTLYKMRWNPASPGYPQYATDIAWATKQVTNIKNMYAQLDNPILRFYIPNYK